MKIARFTPIAGGPIVENEQLSHRRGPMPQDTLVTGQILGFAQSPFGGGDPGNAARICEAVLIRDGKIAALGTATDLRAHAPEASRVDMGDALICAGFVDAHVHYP